MSWPCVTLLKTHPTPTIIWLVARGKAVVKVSFILKKNHSRDHISTLGMSFCFTAKH